MSLEKELLELKRFKGQINYLNQKLSDLYKEKQKYKEEIGKTGNKGRKNSLKEELDRINGEIENSKKMLTYYKNEVEILEIITSISNKEEKQENIIEHEEDSKEQEIQQLKPQKDKFQHLNENTTREKIIRKIINLALGDSYPSDDYPSVKLNVKSKRSLFYRGKQAKESRFVTRSKEIIQKIRRLYSKCKEKYQPQFNKYKDVAKSAVKRISKTVFSENRTLFKKYEPQHVMQKEKGKPQHTMQKSKTKPQHAMRNIKNKPSKEKKRFTGIGIKRKIEAILLAASIGLTSSASILEKSKSAVDNNIPHSIEDSLTRGNKQNSKNVFTKLMNEKGIYFDLDEKGETPKVETTKLEEAPKEETTKVEETPKEDLPELDQDSTNIDKPNDIDTPENVEGTKPENQIKKIYGGEISASENGILTEEDILYAATQMGWKKEIIENIKEMMPGILDMQRDFDVSPLVFLALAQAESNCGTAYQPGGSDYARDNDYRAVNIEFYKGQIGVVAFSNTNYGIHAKWSDVPYDFGNYLRNGPPYTETPALTMKDLKAHGEYKHIFNSADTQGTAIYNQLKACLEKRVTLSDISNATRALTTSEIKEMSDTITSSINKQKSVNKQISGR